MTVQEAKGDEAKRARVNAYIPVSMYKIFVDLEYLFDRDHQRRTEQVYKQNCFLDARGASKRHNNQRYS